METFPIKNVLTLIGVTFSKNKLYRGKIMNDNDIINKVNNCNNFRYVNKQTFFTEEEKKYINNRYIDSSCFKESYLRILNNINEHPKCPICGKPVKFRGLEKQIFRHTCGSFECSHNTAGLKTSIKYKLKTEKEKQLIKEHRKETIKKRYNVNSYFELDTIKQKIKQTKLERYGDENYNNHQQTIQTCLKKYGYKYIVQVPEIQEKIKQTVIEKYGVENVSYNSEIINKIKQTKVKRYNNENYNNREQSKQTCLEKYGVDNPFKSKEIQDKFKQTIIDKYGCDCPFKSIEIQNKFKQTIINKYGKEFNCFDLDKAYKIASTVSFKTKLKNNSFSKSKEEDKCYELLKEKYFDIIRQYRSELYPFNCDFYIPSRDLYVEYNGSQYHHNHPFDKNNKDDIKELHILQEKSNNSLRHKQGKKSQYDTMIYVWTDLDVRKRNIAKQNNLNFIEFWNLTDVNKFIQQIK